MTALPYPNYWDLAAILLVLSVIVLIAWGVREMGLPYQVGETIPISLDPWNLPYYALRSVLRMLIAMVFSLGFTFIFGTLAAKNKHAERLIVPLIDVLQSVPVLAFLSITIVGFIALFPGSMLGPECAAIFAIFTSQAWNIALSFYQSLRTVPHDLREAASMFHLSFWQGFWRVDVPFAMPGLLWNIMVSMSASWFFVVAAESITVANRNIMLPGIGSYISLAVMKADAPSVLYAIVAMLIVILLYDQLLFRPLSNWANRFKFEQDMEYSGGRAWLVNLFEHTRLMRRTSVLAGKFWSIFVNLRLYRNNTSTVSAHKGIWHRWIIATWYILLSAMLGVACYILIHFVFQYVSWRESVYVIYLGLLTGIRVMVLIAICSIIWVPVGVWIGLRPKFVDIFQPIIQILAAFPANLFFPVVVMLIVTYHLNVEIWTSPLMVLGTQWYILFNVIAGASALPKEMQQVASNFNVTGWLWWKRIILPGIFPYYVTGAVTAAGGAWNASIIAEAVNWGHTKLLATGLGAYITEQATKGDFPRLALGTAVMCLFVIFINRVLWKPLYNVAEQRCSLE
ncbi:MAG: ABC transporter permease subunit [Gammaproteobacteria bacterium]|nr:ABC transporter permease subunit [Gammaproteobacteria bacterium]